MRDDLDGYGASMRTVWVVIGDMAPLHTMLPGVPRVGDTVRFPPEWQLGAELYSVRAVEWHPHPSPVPSVFVYVDPA